MRSADPVPSAAMNTRNPSVRSCVEPLARARRCRRRPDRTRSPRAAACRDCRARRARARSAPSCARAAGRTAATGAAWSSGSSVAPHVFASVCRERGLLVEQLLRAVAQPARLEQRDDRARRQQVGQEVLVGRQPRQPRLHAVERLPFGEALPLLRAPRLRLQQLGRACAAPPRSRAARAPGRSTHRRSSIVERWSATENCDSRSTSSPHRSMRTGWSAVDGYTSTIAPRTATSPRASTWYSRR